ncbi:MAG: tyrosine-type recombinase/integrase [archaeon]
MGIHNYEKNYLAALRGLKKAQISERNKELILQMNDALVLENLSKPRLMKYIEIMRSVAKKLDKDLDKATIDDLKKFVSKIQQSDLSPWTKQTYKVIIRRFYKWLKGTSEFPEIVNWINIRMSRSEKKLPSEGDLLTDKEVKLLIDTAEHPRDKAFVSILWESGARVGEIGNLKLKNVIFDKYGIRISVQGKTGSRKMRLISSTPYISTWLANHPDKDNNNAFLWINYGKRNHNKIMNYSNIIKLLQKLFRKAGIKKRSNPHIFRHSRATFMANHLTEFQMNQYFGWIQGSDMPATYVHMSGREVDNAILMMNGIKTDESRSENKLIPQICPRCDMINSHGSKHCNKCGGILDLKYAMEMETQKSQEITKRRSFDLLMDALLEDDIIKNRIKEKMEKSNVAGFSF